MPLDVLDVVKLGGEGIVDVDDDDLPISLTLVEESPVDSKQEQMISVSERLYEKWSKILHAHDTENLDLLDLSNVSDLLSDLTDVERVVVSSGLGLGVNLGRVLPSL